MTRSELIKKLAIEKNISNTVAEKIISEILKNMTDTLISGKRIEIRGFGSFSLNYRPPRLGRNPKTGSKVQVPEKHVPHFKAGKELRERVDLI